MFIEETVHHALFQCEAHVNRYEKFMCQLQDIAPPPLYQYFYELRPYEKLTFILSGMHNSACHEWLHMYIVFIDFIHDVYVSRQMQV